MEITEELKRTVWEKGLINEKYPANVVRQDACGAFMVYDHFGNRESSFGWEIDHICPQSYLTNKNDITEEQIDNIINLRPLNWRNNASKAGDYPYYTAVLTASEDQTKNVEINEGKVVNKTIQDELGKFYHLSDLL